MIKRYELKNENIGAVLEGYAKTPNGACDWYVLRSPDSALLSVGFAPRSDGAHHFVNGFLHSGSPLIITPQTRLFSNGPGQVTVTPELLALLGGERQVHAYLATKPRHEKSYLPSVLTFSYDAPPGDLYNPYRDIDVQGFDRR